MEKEIFLARQAETNATARGRQQKASALHKHKPRKAYLMSSKKCSIKRYKSKQSKKQQQQQEREQLYEFQQQQAIRRFPTRLSDKQEIDRLKVCVAQCLAVMDRFMDFIELKQCPFTMEDPNKPESKR